MDQLLHPRNPSDLMILDNWVLLSFISVNILSAKAFLIFVFCPVVNNKSWGNFSSWKFFLVILNVVPVLFLMQIFVCLVDYLLVWLLLLDNSPSFIKLLCFLERILIVFLWFFLKSLTQTWIVYYRHLNRLYIFNFQTNSICWIVFGWASNSFCLLNSTAINL